MQQAFRSDTFGGAAGAQVDLDVARGRQDGSHRILVLLIDRRDHRGRPDSMIEHDPDTPPDPFEVPAPPSRVLAFPPAAKSISAITAEDEPRSHSPMEEAVVRVRNAPVSGLTDAPVQRAEILKGYEVAKDEFVLLAPEHVASFRA